MRHRRSAIASLGLLAAAEGAHARNIPLEQGIHFVLKPIQGLLPQPENPPAGSRFQPRIDRVDPVNADDRAHDIQLGLQRQSRRVASLDPVSYLTSSITPRSRLTRFVIEDRLPIGDYAAVSFGWHGIKLSNRNANVTVGADKDRLRTRDWFLPRAAMTLRADRDLTLTLGYSETLRAYGETGIAGPMGLTHQEFQSLRQTLKPETQSRMQLRADWAATPALALSVTAHAGRLDDRLGFIGRSALPVNSGSAQIDGMVLEAGHRLSPHMRWSLRYGNARLRVSGQTMKQERSMAIGAVWEDGPWRASARLARSSTPALGVFRRRPVQIAAGIDYAVTALARRPLRLSIHMIDPDCLASTAFARDDLSGAQRAVDQAHGVMARATFDW